MERQEARRSSSFARQTKLAFSVPRTIWLDATHSVWKLVNISLFYHRIHLDIRKIHHFSYAGDFIRCVGKFVSNNQGFLIDKMKQFDFKSIEACATRLDAISCFMDNKKRKWYLQLIRWTKSTWHAQNDSSVYITFLFIFLYLLVLYLIQLNMKTENTSSNE